MEYDMPLIRLITLGVLMPFCVIHTYLNLSLSCYFSSKLIFSW